jgi:hypothetical protein
VVPDAVDLRDRPYLPGVSVAPRAALDNLKKHTLPVLNQKSTNACTGFALATVVNYLLLESRRRRDAHVSPYMIYSMARRYDEFPGSAKDTGSSLRGAMKGWYKHGVCANALWGDQLGMPKPSSDPKRDWWQDAARRPLGAYYRVDVRSVTDMHVALTDAGVLYASVICHDGWDDVTGPQYRIPYKKAALSDGGHAFAIIGYDEHGFLVLNSWGKGWGRDGTAILSYEDWLAHAMDCWVAQLGVVTDQHRAVSNTATLRTSKATGVVQLATDRTLRQHELSPFIIDMENNGDLSQSGEFRTNESDIDALVTDQMAAARRAWGLGPNDPIDVAVYAHGGLTGEDAAAKTAARWIPALYGRQIFPIFLMWETDLWSTLKNRLSDLLRGEPRPTRGPLANLDRWWSSRLEKTLAAPGSAIWGEMKQNAEAITTNPKSGARQLYARGLAKRAFTRTRARLHLIGHSAGSIVHSHAVRALTKAGFVFESVTFMAPAVRLDVFEEQVGPCLKDGSVRRLNEFHLTDAAERSDPTCRPILGYDRSLLYLVSQSFEGGRQTPILGMETYFDAWRAKAGHANVHVVTAPAGPSASNTHGGFDDDEATIRTVLDLIKAPAPVATKAGTARAARVRQRRKARAKR